MAVPEAEGGLLVLQEPQEEEGSRAVHSTEISTWQLWSADRGQTPR